MLTIIEYARLVRLFLEASRQYAISATRNNKLIAGDYMRRVQNATTEILGCQQPELWNVEPWSDQIPPPEEEKDK